MTIEFRCSRCGALLRVPDDSVGRQAKCPACASLTTIPTPSAGTPQTPPDNGNPFATGPLAPPAPPSAASSVGDPNNPYQSPTDYLLSLQAGFAPATAIVPTRIELGDVFRHTWDVFKRSWAICLAGMILAWVAAVVGYVLFYLPILIGVLLDNQAIAVVMLLVGYVALLFFWAWLWAGMLRFLLAVARSGEPSITELFRGGPHILPMLGAMVLFWLFSLGSIVICCWPALVLLLTVSEQAAMIAYFVGILAANIVNLVLLLMFSQSFYLIIDRQMRVLDAFRLSRALTRGNRLTLFVLWLAAILLMALSVLTCGLGLLFAVPFVSLMLPVIYLLITGQPTADQMQYSYSLAPGFAG